MNGGEGACTVARRGRFQKAGTGRERIQAAGTRKRILRPYAPPAWWIRLLGLHLHSVPQLCLCKAGEIMRLEFIAIAPSCQHGLSNDFGTFHRQGAPNSQSMCCVFPVHSPTLMYSFTHCNIGYQIIMLTNTAHQEGKSAEPQDK